MSEENTAPSRPSSDLRDSGLDVHDVFMCMMLQRRHDLRSFPVSVFDGFMTGVDLDVPGARMSRTVEVVPTSLRVIYHDDWEEPEYELEGWILGPRDEKIWLRAAVYWTTREGECNFEASQAVFYRLSPGEEIGTNRTPGIQ